MRPIFENLYEIAKVGGIKDFFTDTFQMYMDTVLEALLLPFAPLFEIFTEEFARIFEDTIPAFTAQMEELSVLFNKLLAIDFGGKDLGDLLGELLGFVGDIISGKLQRDMMAWGEQFAYDLAQIFGEKTGIPEHIREQWPLLFPGAEPLFGPSRPYEPPF